MTRTPIEIEHHNVVDSTSLRARRLVQTGATGPRPRAIVAQRQTSGVGRFGREWHSPEGGVWLTIIWPSPQRQALVPEEIGIEIGRACLTVINDALSDAGADRRATLKWPNDLLIDSSKVAGILTEVVQRKGRASILVGIGVNADFSADDLPPELRATATTLRDVTGAPVDRDALTRRIIEAAAATLSRLAPIDDHG